MDKQRWLADCFARGMRLATHEKNYDYAHEMFAECVVLDPGNLKFVEAMMANLRAKSAGAGKAVKARGPGFWAARTMRRAAARKNWPEVLRAGVKLLGTSPWHVPTLRAMARACEALHHNEVELVYLKQALDANPKDIERAAQEEASRRASHEPAESESSAERQPRRAKRVFRMPWLELALVGAVVALLLQVFPSWWDGVAAFAVEHLQILLILANVMVVVVLINPTER